MVTLMIVDDEAIVRRGLRTTIDWNSIGVQVVAEATNGSEGPGRRENPPSGHHTQRCRDAPDGWDYLLPQGS